MSLRSIYHCKVWSVIVLHLVFYSATIQHSWFHIQSNTVTKILWTGIDRLIFLPYVGILTFWAWNSGVSSKRPYWTYCKSCGIMTVVSWQALGDITGERLLLLWTEAAMMLVWGSSTLDITTAGIVGISYYWYGFGYCTVLMLELLLTVGGNLMPHTVTPLNVTIVSWCCTQTQDVLHPAECPPAALQTSEWQWTPSVFTTQGSVSVPTLWNIIISYLIKILSTVANVEIVDFADDIMIMMLGPSFPDILKITQTALQTIDNWC